MSREGWRISKLAVEATMIPESDTSRGAAPELVAGAGEAGPAREAAVATAPVSHTAAPIEAADEASEVQASEVQASEVQGSEVQGSATPESASTVDEVTMPAASGENQEADDARAAGRPEAVEGAAAVAAQADEDEPAQPDDDAGPEARPDELRLIEALLFAATSPLDEKTLAKRLPAGTDVHGALKRLQLEYAPRGVNLVRIGSTWAFRTANDLAWLLTHEANEPKKLSRAAIETLAIVAYHQPVTRAEIEDIRGVAVAKGTLDVLMETGWIRLRGRRKAPGRPVTYGTTDQFLSHFGLEQLGDLPGLDELKGAGLFDGQLPAGFGVPSPSDDPALRDDEEPLDAVELDLGLAPRVDDAADEPPPPAGAGEPGREEGD